MFRKIRRNDVLFQSDLFLKDNLAFCVMEGILNDGETYPDTKIFSNGKNCAIVNSDPEHKVIVWTADDFQEYEELYDFIKQEFRANTPLRMMSKNAFYNYLVENKKMEDLGKYIKKNEYNADGPMQRLGCYSCATLKDIQYNGYPDQAKPEEVELVVQMLVDFDRETKENPNSVLADRIEKAKKFVSDPMHLIWRNNSGKLVATANVKTNVAHPRVGSVFTLKEERGKSYAKMLVHYLSSLVLKSGKMPMLFTDYDYTPSNRCYEAVGYRLNCVMANFNPSPKYNINEIIQQRFERSQKEGR